MGLLEQILSLRSAMDGLLTVSLQVEESQVRIGKQIKENIMDAVQFLAIVKQISDSTTIIGADVTAIGTAVGEVGVRMTALLKIVSDNVTGNAAVDAAVAELANDSTVLAASAAALTSNAAALKAIRDAAVTPAPVAVVPADGQTPDPQAVG